MRLTRATTGLVVVAVLATVGTGFAAFTTSAYIDGGARAGTFGPLVWGSQPAYGGFEPNDVCYASLGPATHFPDDTLYLTASVLLPGDICSYGDTLTNLGSIPANVSEQITSVSGILCGMTVFGDNFFSPAVTIGEGGQTSALSHVVPATSSIQWAGFIHLLPTATDLSSGENCTFVVTLSASAGT